MNRARRTLIAVLATSATTAGLTVTGFVTGSTANAVVAGAGFTTSLTDASCVHGTMINCNTYADKADVYMTGGPVAAGLSDGDYFFAVLVPGYQNGGFLEGADGNLSDETMGVTTGDTGTGDAVDPERTFAVTGHEISSYGGTHAVATNGNGRQVIALAPFDDTSNSGGVYILAICSVGATSPSDCKFDAFKVAGDGGTVSNFGVVSGEKYYDTNANGTLDPGEVGIGDWPIDYADGSSGTIYTDADGTFSQEFDADTYTFSEELPGSPWMQTGNTSDQTQSDGTASAVLNADKTYTVSTVDNSTVQGINFGNVCVGAGGGLTLGYWGNHVGAPKKGAASGPYVTLSDLTLLNGLHLVWGNGTSVAVKPLTTSNVSGYFLGASATNMAYMLSVQLATMELNVAHLTVSPLALVYAPGVVGANAAGFISVSALMAAANTDLATNTVTVASGSVRDYQATMKTALDNANNNRTFVQSGPSSCPTPVFP